MKRIKRRKRRAKLGDCYEASANCITLGGAVMGTDDEGNEHDLTDLMVLVHGQVDPPGAPHVGRHGHAWLEIETGDGDAYCLDVSRKQRVMMPRETYYRLGGVDADSCYRYTRDQTRLMLLAFCHFGPWEGEEACPPQLGGE